MARSATTTKTVEEPPKDGGGFVLVVSDGPTTVQFELPREGTIFIGRDADCEVVLHDESVSRRHASIRCGARPQVSDLGSRNGTKLTGRSLAANESIELRIGAVLELGSVIAFVRARGSERDAPGPARVGERGDATQGVIVRDPMMLELYALLNVIAPSKISILILGETGVGKEVYASRIHALSDRKRAAFLRLNCAALTESLLEAELFGFEKGAFTGAINAKPGLFEAADGGTVFLDEVGEMTLATQAKLLRVLENGEIVRIGSVKPKRVDVRIVAATNRDLETLSQVGTFRSDLFFRLNGVSVTLPPLRRRPLDILPLSEGFAEKHNAKLSGEAQTKLAGYRWPGNARELKNVVDRAALMARGETILPEHITFGFGSIMPPAPANAPDPWHRDPSSAASGGEDSRLAVDAGVGLRGGFADVERARVMKAMEECGGNQSRAAKMLSVARSTLIRRLEEYGVTRPRKAKDEEDE